MRHAISPIGPRPITATLPPVGICAYSTACQAVGQHVGEEQEAVVGRPVRHLDRAVLGLRHPQVARPGRPAPRRRAWCSRTAPRPSPPRGPAWSRTATAARVAHEAVPAGDVERDDDAVADGDVRHLGADRLDDAHRLVAEDVALADERPEHLVEVQVGAAEPGRGDADDRVGRLLDRRVGDGVDAHVALAVPGEGLHSSLSSSAEPGSAILRCISAFALSGRNRLPRPWALVCERGRRRRAPCRPSAPRSRRARRRPGRPCRRRRPSVSSMSARSKNSVSVGPGISDVTVTSGVLELVAQRQREGLHERLRRVVDGLEGAGHRRGDRRGEEHPALVAGDHVGDDVLGEVHGGADVEVDDPQLVAPGACGRGPGRRTRRRRRCRR